MKNKTKSNIILFQYLLFNVLHITQKPKTLPIVDKFIGKLEQQACLLFLGQEQHEFLIKELANCNILT